jgi:hypothetical protein
MPGGSPPSDIRQDRLCHGTFLTFPWSLQELPARAPNLKDENAAIRLATVHGDRGGALSGLRPDGARAASLSTGVAERAQAVLS